MSASSSPLIHSLADGTVPPLPRKTLRPSAQELSKNIGSLRATPNGTLVKKSEPLGQSIHVRSTSLQELLRKRSSKADLQAHNVLPGCEPQLHLTAKKVLRERRSTSLQGLLSQRPSLEILAERNVIQPFDEDQAPIESLMSPTSALLHSAFGGFQNGDSQPQYIGVPHRIDGLSDIVQVACGWSHSLALTRDGRVLSWGSNKNGRLGRSTKPPTPVASSQSQSPLRPQSPSKPSSSPPSSPSSLPADEIQQLQDSQPIAPEEQATAATNDDKLVSKQTSSSQSASPEADDNSTAPNDDNTSSKLSEEEEKPPSQNDDSSLDTADIPSFIPTLVNIRKIACGDHHSAALSHNGTLFVWGRNEFGMLGLGHRSDVSIPSMVPIMPLINALSLPDNACVEDVSCGANHTVIVVHGRALASGWNTNNRLGLVSQRHFIHYASYGLDDINFGDMTVVCRFQPIKGLCTSVRPGNNLYVRTVAAADVMTLAIADHITIQRPAQHLPYSLSSSLHQNVNNVFLWGTAIHSSPYPIIELNNYTIADVCMGSNFCVLRTQQGQVMCFGSNRDYQLGRPASSDLVSFHAPSSIVVSQQFLPTDLSTVSHPALLSEISRPYLGHSQPHRNHGGSSSPSSNPLIPPTDKLVFLAIACGKYHGLALDQYGRVFGWGLNKQGILGVNSSESSLAPCCIQPTHLLDEKSRPLFASLEEAAKADFRFVAMAGGASHTLLVDNKGFVYAMGSFRNGKLGL